MQKSYICILYCRKTRILLKFVSNVNKMSERNIGEPEPREVGNHHRDVNFTECLDPTAENKVFHNVDFYTEFPMPETKLEPHTENIIVPDEKLNDDPSKDSHRLQTHDHLRRPGELSFEYTELRKNHRSSAADSTNLKALVSIMPLNSAVDVRLKSECPPVYAPRLPALPAAEVYNTVMLVPSGFEDNQGQPPKSQSNVQTLILKNTHERTDNSPQLAGDAPSMNSPICASLVSKIPTDSLQLSSPVVQASDNVYENKVIMDIDKPIMSVTSEPYEDNKVHPSTGPSHFDTVMQGNTLGGKDNLLTKAFNVECNLNIHAETRDYQRNTLLMNTDAFHVNLPLAFTANLKEETFANAVKYHSSMPNIPAITGYQGNSFLMPTEHLHKQDNMPSSAACPSKGKNETFVDMDILNMASVAGPSGYGINSAVVPNVSESPVTPVPAANCQSKYICEFCEYKANYKSVMESHMRVHTGERPFECNICHGCFKQKCELERHVRIHTGEKPYVCDVCNYKSSQKSNLIKHKQKHSRK